MKKLKQLALALLLPVLVICCSRQPEPVGVYDVLIVNGIVYDGRVAPPRNTNIGITGDRIVSTDAAADAEAGLVIDATGLAVVPGFIDPHTHTLDDLLDPDAHSNLGYLTQGVTTVFVGNDGGGLPNRDSATENMRRQGIGTNVAFYAGHGLIRETVMGAENRAPTDAELDEMRRLVDEEMRAGALGLSTGLFYAPGNFADTAEVIELAKVAAKYDGVYDSHIRDEASYSIGLLGSVKEVLDIAEAADIPVHFAHLKALGRDVWGQSGDIVGLVAAGLERGLSISADQYPWRASGTRFGNALIPRWAMADSRDAMFARLENPDLKDGIREEMEQNLWRRGGSESLLVTGDSPWRGMTLEEIAAQMNLDPVEAAVEVVRSGDPSIASFNMNPDDVRVIAAQPWVMTGSDGSEGHPRKYASFPKAYLDFVRGADPLFSMQQFVHRSAGLAADTFSLCDRGYLQEGRKADIAIIDLENFAPVADFRHPTELSTGVVHMLVNGAMVIRQGEYNGKLPGEVIHRGRLDCPGKS